MAGNVGATLAIELGMAAVQVLREEYDFDEEQANRFLGLMLSRASRNREITVDVGQVLAFGRALEEFATLSERGGQHGNNQVSSGSSTAGQGGRTRSRG